MVISTLALSRRLPAQSHDSPSPSPSRPLESHRRAGHPSVARGQVTAGASDTRRRPQLKYLPLLKALTPPSHNVSRLDENVESLNFDHLGGADMAGLIGMSVQGFSMRKILAELKRWGTFTIVGGPWVTVRVDYFDDLADVRFLGEAKDTWSRILKEWSRGQHIRRYRQTARTDVTQVPAPRFVQARMPLFVQSIKPIRFYFLAAHLEKLPSSNLNTLISRRGSQPRLYRPFVWPCACRTSLQHAAFSAQ
jgi:hypothetical protein